jgi:hypothetical protein
VTDVAVVNIALEVVEAALARLGSPLVVTSGYVASEHPAARSYLEVSRLERDGWAADLFERAE